MRADLLVRNTLTLSAVEELPEEKGRNSQVRKFFKDLLCLIGPVVLSDPCVVPSYRYVCASEILSHDGVQNGLSRSGVLHLIVQNAHHYGACRIVSFHQRLVSRDD